MSKNDYIKYLKGRLIKMEQKGNASCGVACKIRRQIRNLSK